MHESLPESDQTPIFSELERVQLRAQEAPELGVLAVTGETGGARERGGIAPLPEGWTYLIHGTDTARWDASQDSVEITGMGLSVVSAEQAARDAVTGANTTRVYSAPRRGSSADPVEVRVVFPREVVSRRRGVVNESDQRSKEAFAADPATVDLVTRTYQDRHPVVPQGQVLIKIGQETDEAGKMVQYFAPASVAERYAESVRTTFGQEIELPKSAIQATPAEVATANMPAPDAEVTKAIEATPVPALTTKETLETMQPARAAEQVIRPVAEERQERSVEEDYIRSSLGRVPRPILTQTVRAIAHDMARDSGERPDADALGKALQSYLDGRTGLGLEQPTLVALARRVDANGFAKSGQGLWREESARGAVGDVSRAAHALVREIVADAVRNS